jgi:hypothetical protein
MDEEILTEQAFAQKIEWEGSLVDAFVYGLTPDNCEQGKLKDLLVPAYEAFLEFDRQACYVSNYIDGVYDDWDEEA